MAEEKITFKIGSQLTGDGFNKANDAVKGIAQTTGKAKSAIQLAVGEFQKMDGELGKLAGSASNVIQSFASFGVMGGVIAGVQVGVKALADEITKVGDEMLNLVQHANDFHDYLNKIKGDSIVKRMKEAMKEATTEATRAMQAVKDTADAINALSGAKAEGAVAAANEKLAQLMKQKAEAVAGALGEFQKQVETARGDLKIAQYELEEAHRSAAEQVKKADLEYEQAQQRQLQAIDNLVAAKRAVEIAETDYKKAMLQGSVKLGDYERVLEQARTAEYNAMTAKTKADNDVAVALEKQETAQTNMRTTIIKAETKVIQLTATRDEAIKKLEENNKKEKKLGMTTAEFEKMRKDELERAKKESEELRRANEARIKAIEENIKVLEEEKKSLKDWASTVDKAEQAYKKHHEWMGANDNWERTESGGVRNFKDFLKAERWADRAERDKVENSMYFKGQSEKAAQIQAKIDSGKKVSAGDREFLDRWNKYSKQLKSEDSLDKQITEWKEKQTSIAEETKEVLESIQRSLEEQGLK